MKDIQKYTKKYSKTDKNQYIPKSKNAVKAQKLDTTSSKNPETNSSGDDGGISLLDVVVAFALFG